MLRRGQTRSKRLNCERGSIFGPVLVVTISCNNPRVAVGYVLDGYMYSLQVSVGRKILLLYYIIRMVMLI